MPKNTKNNPTHKRTEPRLLVIFKARFLSRFFHHFVLFHETYERCSWVSHSPRKLHTHRWGRELDGEGSRPDSSSFVQVDRVAARAARLTAARTAREPHTHSSHEAAQPAQGAVPDRGVLDSPAPSATDPSSKAITTAKSTKKVKEKQDAKENDRAWFASIQPAPFFVVLLKTMINGITSDLIRPHRPHRHNAAQVV
jgi:hypothetical protein